MVGTTEKDKNKTAKKLGWVNFFKEIRFNFFLNEERNVAEHTSSGRSFQILGASHAKLRQKCFLDLYVDAKCGTSSSTPSD